MNRTNNIDQKIKQFGGISNRIDAAMKAKYGEIISDKEFCENIQKNQGEAPSISLFSKLRSAGHEAPFYNMKIDNLMLIAKELDVSTDYLLGLKDQMETEGEKDINSLGLSSTSIKHLQFIRKKAITYNRWSSDEPVSVSTYWSNG